jgi:hypothetical protein
MGDLLSIEYMSFKGFLETTRGRPRRIQEKALFIKIILIYRSND